MELSKEAKKKRLEYMRNWRAKNKDKVKLHQRTYWERLAAEEQQEA